MEKVDWHREATGAWVASIMAFFGAVFAAMMLTREFHLRTLLVAPPFLAFAAIAILAAQVIRKPGAGLSSSKEVERVMNLSIRARNGLALLRKCARRPARIRMVAGSGPNSNSIPLGTTAKNVTAANARRGCQRHLHVERSGASTLSVVQHN